MEKIVLGIDPGTNILGYGIILSKNNQIEVIYCDILSLKKIDDSFTRLKKIFEFIVNVIDKYKPDELAIESQFYGKNVQSMLKLGRAQGVAISAALHRELPIFEYSPKKIKQSITGNGNASKEQVSGMLKSLFNYDFADKPLDATDAVAVAVCHCFQNKINHKKTYSNWKSFLSKNPDRIV